MIDWEMYYWKFVESLKKKGFRMNLPDPCVGNKKISGKLCSICFQVDDCNMSYVSAEDVDNIIIWQCQEYEHAFTDGSSKMRMSWGKIHKYLGMTLDFKTKR